MPKGSDLYMSAAMSAAMVEGDCTEYNCVNCKAPCCGFHVGLNEQELKNGHYLVTEAPGYPILARTKEGACVYQNPDGSCGIYARRPWICRTYTCEKDTRIDDVARFETGRPNIDTLLPDEKASDGEDTNK